MTKLLTIIFLLTFAEQTISQIQTISSQKTFGTNYNEENQIAKVYDGFLYLLITPSSAGISQDKTVAGYNGQDAWFVKMDLDFNVLSQFVYGGNFYDQGADFVKCANGDFILLMTSNSDISGNKTVPAIGGSSDYWVVRINSMGDIIWQETYGGTDDESASEIMKINENKFVLFGTSRSPISGNKTSDSYGLSDAWSVFIDGQGNILHQHVYGGDGPEILGDISLNLSSNRIVYGVSSGSDISGNKTTSKYGFYDGWVFTTDTNGVLLDQINLGGPANTFNDLIDLTFTPSDKILVLMSADNGIGGTKTLTGSGMYDAWLVELDLNLNITNQKVYGGTNNEGCNSLFLSGDNVILSLISYSGMDGNKTEPNYGNFDNWFVCIDPAGNILWQKSVGGNQGENALIAGEPSTNNYLVVSNTTSGISGNKTVPIYVTGSSDLWLFKLNSTLQVEKLASSLDLSISPNPFADEITFSWKTNEEKVILEILDLQGKIVSSSVINNVTSYTWMPVNLSSGVYLYQIKTNNGFGMGRILKK